MAWKNITHKAFTVFLYLQNLEFTSIKIWDFSWTQHCSLVYCDTKDRYDVHINILKNKNMHCAIYKCSLDVPISKWPQSALL